MELERIKDIVAELMSADAGSIGADTRFVKDLGMDSLDMFQLAAELEDAFGIELPDEAAERFKTLGDAAEYIKNRQ